MAQTPRGGLYGSPSKDIRGSVPSTLKPLYIDSQTTQKKVTVICPQNQQHISYSTHWCHAFSIHRFLPSSSGHLKSCRSKVEPDSTSISGNSRSPPKKQHDPRKQPEKSGLEKLLKLQVCEGLCRIRVKRLKSHSPAQITQITSNRDLPKEPWQNKTYSPESGFTWICP